MVGEDALEEGWWVYGAVFDVIGPIGSLERWFFGRSLWPSIRRECSRRHLDSDVRCSSDDGEEYIEKARVRESLKVIDKVFIRSAVTKQ